MKIENKTLRNQIGLVSLFSFLSFFFLFFFYYRKKNIRLCLVTVFVFYFQKLVFGNIKKKQFSCIFEIKNMFG